MAKETERERDREQKLNCLPNYYTAQPNVKIYINMQGHFKVMAINLKQLPCIISLEVFLYPARERIKPII